jgi:hypothetical protein
MKYCWWEVNTPTSRDKSKSCCRLPFMRPPTISFADLADLHMRMRTYNPSPFYPFKKNSLRLHVKILRHSVNNLIRTEAQCGEELGQWAWLSSLWKCRYVRVQTERHLIFGGTPLQVLLLRVQLEVETWIAKSNYLRCYKLGIIPFSLCWYYIPLLSWGSWGNYIIIGVSCHVYCILWKYL